LLLRGATEPKIIQFGLLAVEIRSRERHVIELEVQDFRDLSSNLFLGSTVVPGLIFGFRHCTDREVCLVESPNRRYILLNLYHLVAKSSSSEQLDSVCPAKERP
jgi:hypothetical protein